MDDDNGVSGEGDGRLKNLPGMRQALVQGSFRDFLDGNQPVSGIQQNGSQGFPVEHSKLVSKQAMDRNWRIQRLGSELFSSQPCTHGKGGSKLNRFG